MGHSFHAFGTNHVVLAWIFGLLLSALPLFAMCWIIGILVSAYREVSTADRAEYSLCDKHGAIRQTDMLTIAEGENGEIIDPVCPKCYTENLKHAKERVLDPKKD